MPENGGFANLLGADLHDQNRDILALRAFRAFRKVELSEPKERQCRLTFQVRDSMNEADNLLHECHRTFTYATSGVHARETPSNCKCTSQTGDNASIAHCCKHPDISSS